jgi:hypothetical protein
MWSANDRAGFAARGWEAEQAQVLYKPSKIDQGPHLGLSANIVRAGASGGTMRIAPPLTVGDAEIDLKIEFSMRRLAR